MPRRTAAAWEPPWSCSIQSKIRNLKFFNRHFDRHRRLGDLRDDAVLLREGQRFLDHRLMACEKRGRHLRVDRGLSQLESAGRVGTEIAGDPDSEIRMREIQLLDEDRPGVDEA